MSETTVLAQISDPHLGARWRAGGDPARGLAAAVDAVLALRPPPDAVLVSGDLTEHGADAEYATVRELLAPFGDVPVHVLPGNHDDRAALRANFALPGAGAEPARYLADVGPLRLVVLDSIVPGADHGRLDAACRAWLEAALAAEPERPAVIALHHPPLLTGSPAWDALGIPGAERDALAGVLARHPQVRGVVGGHVHRLIVAELAGRPVISAPSTYLQARFDLDADGLETVADPAGIAVHLLLPDGAFVTHLQSLRQ